MVISIQDISEAIVETQNCIRQTSEYPKASYLDLRNADTLEVAPLPYCQFLSPYSHPLQRRKELLMISLNFRFTTPN